MKLVLGAEFLVCLSEAGALRGAARNLLLARLGSSKKISGSSPLSSRDAARGKNPRFPHEVDRAADCMAKPKLDGTPLFLNDPPIATR